MLVGRMARSGVVTCPRRPAMAIRRLIAFSTATRPPASYHPLMPHRAHLFPAALASVMQARGVNQVQLHELTGIAVSRINNYLQGKYRTIKPPHLDVICGALGGAPTDKAALVQAYLFDLLPDNCRGLVDIRISGAREAGNWEVPTKGLPKDFAAAFRDLYVLCASNFKVRQRTAEWVEIVRETKS
jgi:DNA-binding Xre family transcriptional regulator